MPPVRRAKPWSRMRLLEFGNPRLRNVPRDVALHRLGGLGDQHLRQHHAPLGGAGQLPRGHAQASQVCGARTAEARQVSPWSPTAGAPPVLLLPRLDKPSEHGTTTCSSGLKSKFGLRFPLGDDSAMLILKGHFGVLHVFNPLNISDPVLMLFCLSTSFASFT